MGRKHDLMPCRFSDPIERELPDAGWVAFEDSETGELFELNTGNAETRRLFAASAEERMTRFAPPICRLRELDIIEAQTTVRILWV